MSHRSIFRLVRLGRVVLGVTALVVLVAPLTVGAQVPRSLVFAGHAEAFGARVTIVVEDAPVSDDVVDISAPATSADLSSAGSSRAFASFPSPGETVLSAPGLLAAVLGQGVGGLPTLELPTLPDYPFAVQADGINPEVRAGQGPYSISAVARPEEARGTGAAGLQVDALGSVVRVVADASVVRETDKVVAESKVVVDGVTVGPLSLGTITSVATVTLEAGGTPDPSTSFVIEGARIAGLPVTITAEGIALAGATVPLPISGTLEEILAAAGIGFDFGTATEAGGAATSPGITITRDIQLPGVGAGSGTSTIQLGYVSASLTPPPPRPAVVPPAADGGDTGSVGGDLGGVWTDGGSSTPNPNTPTRPDTTLSTPTAEPDTTPAAGAELDLSGLTGLAEAIDLRSLYLASGLAGIATFGLGAVLRLLGVRPT